MEPLENLVDNYRMPDEAVQLLSEHPPLMICGVTGAGKDTIARYLMQTGNYAHVVSHTSRAARPHMDGHEVNGVDYWFISNQEAAELLKNQAFVEAKLVHGKETLYGTSIMAYRRVVDNNKQPVLEIDIQGVQELQRAVPDLKAIFLVPPSFEVWQERLKGRGKMSNEELRARLVSAVTEFKTFLASDGFTPIINSEVIDTARSIENGSYADADSAQKAHDTVEELLLRTQALLETL